MVHPAERDDVGDSGDIPMLPLLTTEDRYRLLAENASDIVYQTDGLAIEWISPSVTTLLGWKPDELAGMPASTIVSPNQDRSWMESNRTLLLSGADVTQEMLLIGSDGEERWFSGRARPLSRNGVAVGGFMVGLHDIHEEVLTRRALLHSERMYRSAIENAGVGIALLTPSGSIIEANDSLCDYLGRGSDELVALGWRAVTHPDDIAEEESLLMRLQEGQIDSFRRTKRYIRSDGEIVHGDLTVAAARDDDGTLLLLTKQVVDITEQTESRARLTDLATIDPLTLLANRASILSELQTALAARRRDPDNSGQLECVGLLFVDLDNFKLINDSMGHAAGDSLLTTVAGRLRSDLGSDAVVGRFGGDEFLVVVPAPADESTLEAFAQRVSSSLSDNLSVHGRRVVMRASIGASLSQPESTAASLLQDADVALSQAKREGKAGWRIFNLGMASAAIRRLVVEGELREALERSEFVVHYQPVFRLGDNTRSGFEALVRWAHPREGLLAPDQFLQVAEDSGLVVGIGYGVLRRVCDDIAQNPTLTDTFAVNVSAVQLHDPQWLSSVLETIAESGVDPARLVIELTETAVMSGRETLSDDLAALRAIGVEIHVDDFGTGYSSISLLRDLPISGLKLDRSFVVTLDQGNESGYALAEGLASLTRSIGLVGVAEGIETPVQAALLRAMGWSHGQGWLFGKAAPLETWLR
ncbi:MAG: EAL domain-containing protein [Actinobacteria bacterium]|uniref:Unannotated protein n=1 Tax=freshwater metagenome TaxID=449393 RepID=A0A6J7QYB8_9ZZZZ|nr:EAL domain-containing protein [Actinomycetota bacterium]